MSTNQQGRTFPSGPPTRPEAECQIGTLKSYLRHAQEDAAKAYQDYINHKNYCDELREAIDYLERIRFEESKGISVITSHRKAEPTSPISTKRAVKKAKAALSKKDAAADFLTSLRSTNPKKYQAVVKAMLEQGSSLPPGHGLEDEEDI